MTIDKVVNVNEQSDTTKEVDRKIAKAFMVELKKPAYKRKDVIIDIGLRRVRFLAKDITRMFANYMPKDEQDLLDYMSKKERN